MKKFMYPFLIVLFSITVNGICIARDGNSFTNQSSFINKSANDSTSPDLKIIYLRCRHLLLSDTAYANEQSYRLTDDIIYTTDAEGYLKTFTPEGYWTDLNYQSPERNAWTPSWHLYRLMLFVRAWNKTGQTEYLKAVHRGLDYWIKGDFKCENWWHNQINIPFTYSSLMIMLDKEATQAELAFLDNVISKRVPQNNATGQNKLWQHDIEARIALIHNDGVAFRKAVEGMKSLVEITTKEGIQPDYSYHQHGAMLQFGSYGFHYVNSLLFWMTTTARSQFAFDADKETILFNYCSNGLRWTIFNKRMDLTAIGRQLRLDCDLKRGIDLNNDFNLIKTTYSVDPCAFSLDGFQSKEAKPCSLSGNKGFWRSDYMVQQNNGAYMMSVKTHGNFVKKIESINSENLEGAFLNDGVSLIQHSGGEYSNIEPFWNWTMLPGTTCDTTLNPADPNVLKASNQSDFVGQVSDDKSGISAMVYNKAGIRANKSYFFADNLLVALGSGIEALNPANVVTTIDQKFNHHPAQFSAPNKPNQWIWQNNIGYFIPGNQDVKIKKVHRKGDWTKVDKVSTTETKTDSVITIYLGHKNHNSYSYIVNPDCKLSEFKKMVSTSTVKILSNTTDVQAIQYSEGVMAVFYKPVGLQLSSTTSIQTNHPCVLIYKQQSIKKEIWVSDPTRKLSSLQIKIGSKSVDVVLPSGDYAGSSVKAKLPD